MRTLVANVARMRDQRAVVGAEPFVHETGRQLHALMASLLRVERQKELMRR